MNRKIVIVALAAAMALTLTGLAWADEGDAKPEEQRAGYLQQGIMQQLTPEQREEFRSTIAEMLKGWGIKAPPLGAGPLWGQRGMGMMQQGQRGMGMMQQGQRGMGMMQQGQRGMGMMQQPGQQAGPPHWGQQQQGWQQGRYGQQAGPPHWGQPASPPRWGQQAGPPGWGQPAPPPYWGHQGPPPQWGQQQQGWRGQQGGYGQQAQPPWLQMIMQRLTPEQREQVKAKITELHEEGTEPQEIREAVREMLEGWDIQLPPRPQSQ